MPLVFVPVGTPGGTPLQSETTHSWAHVKPPRGQTTKGHFCAYLKPLAPDHQPRSSLFPPERNPTHHMCIYTYMYIYTYTCVCMYVCMYIYIYIYIHTYIYTSIRNNMCVYVYIYTYTAHMQHIYIYIYIYIHHTISYM